MKRFLKASFAILCVFIWINFSWADQNDRYLTTTLLPVEEKVLGENDKPEVPPEPYNKSYLWAQQNPKRLIFLRFDLNGLPSDLKEFEKCSLRIVAKEPKYRPEDNKENTGGDTVSLKGRLPADEKSIVAFNDIESISNITVAVGATSQLRAKIKEKFLLPKGNRFFTIILETGSDKAGALFYSTSDFNENPTNRPRLVISYTLPAPELLDSQSWTQHQHDPEHTGRSAWRPYQTPTGFSLTKIDMPKINGSAGTIADYPLIYRGNIYLVYKVLESNFLLALDYKGQELWRKDIGEGTVQRSPVISTGGIFYVVTEKKITGYDLNRSGQQVALYPQSGDLPGKPAAYSDLTAGNDGSLFLALQEAYLNYIYGFTSDLKPIIKSRPWGKGIDKISTVTVRPDGGAVFAQTAKGAVLIDVTNPSQEQSIKLKHSDQAAWEYYHVPIAGPAGGMMIFADFTGTANKGNVWGYTADKWIWNSPGTLIPQPVLGSNKLIYFIQNGALQRHPYDKIGSGESPSGAGLNTTSNLVMDGADNVYFWDNGILHCYDSEKSAFIEVDFTSNELAKKRPVVPEVTAVNVTDGGQGYLEAPTVSIAGGGGSGAVAIALIDEGKVSRVEILNGGQGFTEAPAVTFSGGEGSGAKADAVIKKADQEGEAPEQFIRLMLGPDGTLWANNKLGSALYAFKPSFADPNPTLEDEKKIDTKTVYRATGTLTVDSSDPEKVLKVEAGTQILLQAQQGISLRNFAVEKGAELLCRTGF